MHFKKRILRCATLKKLLIVLEESVYYVHPEAQNKILPPCVQVVNITAIGKHVHVING